MAYLTRRGVLVGGAIALGSLALPAKPGLAYPDLRFAPGDPALVYQGDWEPAPPIPGEPPARRARFAMAAVALTYRGPWVSWLTDAGPDRGIARVLIDGQVRDEEIDLYNPTIELREFRWSTLVAERPHVIRIEVTGNRNIRSVSSWVVHRGFVVPDAPVLPSAIAEVQPTETPVPRPGAPGQVPPPVPLAPGTSFYRATDPLITYIFVWETVPGRPASEILPALPPYRQARTRLSSAEFAFNGPSITWHTLAGPEHGIARVTIRSSVGAPREDFIDLYHPVEELRSYSWSVADPTRISTIRIDVWGDHSAQSKGDLVVILGFSTPKAPVPPTF
jgi:hypothetical protein